MLYVKFLNEIMVHEAVVRKIARDVVAVKMDVMQPNTSGFRVYLDKAGTKMIGDYSKYKKVLGEPGAYGIAYTK